ncbi:aspartate aminotransferase family protein [Bacillus tianshenii]|nr:aspartate aminotransferase family protein [Bacillus tianshenii]
MHHTHLIKPVIDKNYPVAAYGKGIYIYDNTGKAYIDGSSGAVTASIGHAVPEMIAAVAEQTKKISFVYRSQFTSEAAELLAARLSHLAPGNDKYWSFFVNSGSEATETAMKIAIQHWQEKGLYKKHKIISRWNSYHGITIGALSMSGHTERRERFIPLLEDYPAVSAPNCYRCPFQQTYPSCQLTCADELDRAIRRVGAEHVAAFIAEPIVGAAGAAIVPPPGYYERIKEICEFHNVLFIADEVMTGLGRTGKMFGMDHWDAEADIITLGKGMSAGYTPMAATLVKEHVMEPILNGSKSVMSGHTYSANPQSAAVSLAVLDYIEKHDLVTESAENGQYLFQKLEALVSRHEMIGHVRGKGLLIGVEFVANKFTKEPFTKGLGVTSRIVQRAQDNGLLVYPSSAGLEGKLGDAVIISPPLTINRAEIDQLVEIFDRTVSEVAEEIRSLGAFDTVI